MLFIFPSYWTVPYVSIHDPRLVLLYNLAFVCVLGSLLGNLFIHMTYLESDTLHGIAQARLKTGEGWERRTEEEESFCQNKSCVRWDAEEVGYSYTSDSLFLATRIKDSVEQSICEEDPGGPDDIVTCAQYKRVSKLNYYPICVQNLLLLINANSEAPEFCSDRPPTEDCPYQYSVRTLPGRLLSLNGSLLERFNGSEEKLRELTVGSFLEAAGVESLQADSLRWSQSREDREYFII